MKKRLLFIPLITLLALPGCGDKTNGNKKGDVVSNTVLKANTKPQKRNIYSDFELVSNFLTSDGTTYSVSNGFTIITNGSTRQIYSAILGESIAELTPTDTYVTFASDVAGGYIVYTTSEGVSVVDGLGNILIDKSNRTYESLTVTSGLNAKDIYYVDVRFDNTSFYFHYDKEGSATMHSTNTGDDYDTGSTLPGIDYISLDEFGHPGYQLIKNSSRYIVFNAKGNEIASFTDPNADASFFVGDYLIYQNSVKLDENNNNYDYISATGERYSLETYRINYLNAKKEAIEVSYLLSNDSNAIHSFKNSKGINAYAYADLKTISEKKILSNTQETYIIDSAGTLHDNVTGINLGAFERLGDNYYNTDSKTIYDGNLNELSILGNMNPQKVDNADIVVCVMEGKYGAVNHKGKVVLPFEYDYIYTNYLSDNRAIVLDDGKLKIVEFDSKKATSKDVLELEGTNLSYFGCGVYMLDDQYLTLATGELSDFKHAEDSSVEVYQSICYVTSTARVFTLEVSNDTTTYYSGVIYIGH